MAHKERLLIAILATLAVGCALGQRASFPSMPNQTGWKRSFLCFYKGCPDTHAIPVLSNTEMEIALRSHNSHFYPLGNDYFAISFLVNSKLKLAVNLAEFQIILVNGKKVNLHGFIVRKLHPKYRLPASRCLTDDYFSHGGIKNYPIYHPVTSEFYRVMPDTCYDLFFSIAPPKRGETFSLDIQGIMLEGKPYEIPSIHFD